MEDNWREVAKSMTIGNPSSTVDGGRNRIKTEAMMMMQVIQNRKIHSTTLRLGN